MRNAVGFICRGASSLVILRVCGISGGCSEMKSDSRRSSFLSAFVAMTSNLLDERTRNSPAGSRAGRGPVRHQTKSLAGGVI